MKAHLMFQNKDFKIQENDNFWKLSLLADLELDYMISSMARKDELIYESAKEALLNPLTNNEDIIYRQDILSDVLKNEKVIRTLYQITLETEIRRKESWSWLSTRYLSSAFSGSVALLGLYIEMLTKLREVADHNSAQFKSKGFQKLFSMFQKELSDEYIETATNLLNDLKRSDGTLISSNVGNYLQGINYVFRQKERKGFRRRWFFAHAYTLAERDERGSIDIDYRRNRAINESTNVLAQATENLESFFVMLKQELAFYVGCLNLSEKIKKYEMPISLPSMASQDTNDRTMNGLYDLSLLLMKKNKIVKNEIESKNKKLYLITGANQGGKSTFLRSVGQAQIMAQSGMFVCAQEFKAPIRNKIFTHFKKEEDKTLTSGKLDEELIRMSEITDHVEENSMILLNESFASTNELEGSEINHQITKALIENNIEVFAVTHLYTYATSFNDETHIKFLRAQRFEDGKRTFKIEEGKPLRTAFGQDLYHQIFKEESKIEN